MAIVIDIHKALLAIANVRTALTNLERPFAAIGGELSLTTYERFTREVDPNEIKWAPNADSTILNYMSKATGNKHLSKQYTATGGQTVTALGMRALAAKMILRDTGMLQDNMTYQINNNTMIFGPSVQTKKYAAAMQFGIPQGYIPSKPNLYIPARPYLGITPANKVYIQNTFRKYFADAWAAGAS